MYVFEVFVDEVPILGCRIDVRGLHDEGGETVVVPPSAGHLCMTPSGSKSNGDPSNAENHPPSTHFDYVRTGMERGTPADLAHTGLRNFQPASPTTRWIDSLCTKLSKLISVVPVEESIQFQLPSDPGW